MSRDPQILGLGAALVGVSALPALLVVVESLAFAAGHPFLVSTVEAIFGPICHHWPERTLVIGGELLPVCARCTGLYLGCICGLVGLLTGGLLTHPRAVATAVAGLAGLLLVAVALALAEKFDALHTSNAVRVALGLPLGMVPVATLALGSRVVLSAS